MQVLSATAAGQRIFQQIANWSIQQCMHQLQQSSSAEGIAPLETLAWVCQCIEQGCSLFFNSEEAVRKLCRDVVDLQQKLQRQGTGGKDSQRAVVIIVLHILHPIFAQFFREEESLTSLGQHVSPQLPKSSTAKDKAEPDAMQLQGVEHESLKGIPSGGESSVQEGTERGSKQNLTETGDLTFWKESSLWVFLLGNTLLRLLDLIGAPRFGGADQHWPSHR